MQLAHFECLNLTEKAELCSFGSSTTLPTGTIPVKLQKPNIFVEMPEPILEFWIFWILMEIKKTKIGSGTLDFGIAGKMLSVVVHASCALAKGGSA